MSANKVVVTSEGQLVAALTNAATNDTTLISIENPGSDIFTISSTLNIPVNFTGNQAKTLIIEGNGITIEPGSDFGTGIPLMQRINTGANKNCSVVIRNVNFDCKTFDMHCLELSTASNVIVDNCKFNNCKIGLKLTNIDRAAITNCVAFNIFSAGFIDTDIVGVSNSYCNNITYTNCKVQSLTTLKSNIVAFSSYRTSCIAYYECATLGRVGNCINFDSAGGTTPVNIINNVQIRNFTAPLADVAMIYLHLSDGFAKIDGFYITSNGISGNGMVIIEANAYVLAGRPNPHLYVENVPFIPTIGIFKTIGGIPAPLNCPVTPPDDVVVWEFKEIWDGQNIFSASRWYNGLIPFYRYAEFFNESKKILTDSLTINGKFI
jgi:hypothetical protein